MFCAIEFSCVQNINNEKIKQSYEAIDTSTYATRLIAQKFVDTLSNVMRLLRLNKDTDINIKQLRLLLDSTNQSAVASRSALERIKEFDKELEPIKTEIIFQNILILLCNDEFEKSLNILSSNDKDKFMESSRILKPALMNLQQAANKCKDVRQKIEAKYIIRT